MEPIHAFQGLNHDSVHHLGRVHGDIFQTPVSIIGHHQVAQPQTQKTHQQYLTIGGGEGATKLADSIFFFLHPVPKNAPPSSTFVMAQMS